MSTAEQGRVTIPLHKPGLKEKLFFFSSGIIVSIPLASFFENLFASPFAPGYVPVLTIAVLAPIIEEFGKAYPLFYRHGETKKSIMTLGFLVGLGFGIIEFLEYVLILKVPFIFRLPGIFFHAASTSIVGYGIANKKPAVFYLIAVALHFSNNVAALFAPYEFLILIIFTLALYFWWYLYQKTPETIIPY
ncbi:MAG: PrsW family glutamic-type intramembrane protease [Candidatus Bathyarchaeia archaeon]